MVRSSNVKAVAANDVALQHYRQKVVCRHVTTNSGRRVTIQFTFDVMSVRKPLLSTSSLKRGVITIIFKHDYDLISFRKKTVNLASHDCHSYLRITFASGIPYPKAMVMAGDCLAKTWMRKSTLVTVSRGMKRMESQLKTGEQVPMRIKQVQLGISGET